MELVKSRLLDGFAHGFTTRSGGASAGPFASLNLGGAVGDDPRAVAENWRRLAAHTGLSFARVLQVHGDRVLELAAPGRSEASPRDGLSAMREATEAPRPEADAVLSRTKGLAATVSVADCVPILLADPKSGFVAAVHAGWRGTIARIAQRGVEALCAASGARPGELVAAIGPSIGPCCYEVEAGLAERFKRELGPTVANTVPGQVRVDLWLANRVVLKQAGVLPERIDVLGRCASCEDDAFFSHRRDAGKTGRMAAFIAPRL